MEDLINSYKKHNETLTKLFQEHLETERKRDELQVKTIKLIIVSLCIMFGVIVSVGVFSYFKYAYSYEYSTGVNINNSDSKTINGAGNIIKEAE